jgi:hypothetical protein
MTRLHLRTLRRALEALHRPSGIACGLVPPGRRRTSLGHRVRCQRPHRPPFTASSSSDAADWRRSVVHVSSSFARRGDVSATTMTTQQRSRHEYETVSAAPAGMWPILCFVCRWDATLTTQVTTQASSVVWSLARERKAAGDPCLQRAWRAHPFLRLGELHPSL